ncbi:MAG: AIM24 family protein [Burkholderiales bacterium]|nr:AIM24 family protein [Phycisphaerae bacterium]
MGRYTLTEFASKTAQQDKGQGLYELETDRLLEVNLNGMTWIKTGAMVAYLGQIKFEREGIFEQGLGNFFKKAVSGEGAKLTKATGHGKMYLADSGKKITVLQLQGQDSIFVNGNDVLAFEPTLQFTITMMRKMAAMLSGGLFNVRLQGAGLLAITTHYDPLTLRVTPQQPIVTDPNATIAWSGNLTPEFKTDISLKTFFGRGSGESMQMLFQGDGFVVVQPYEEVYMQHATK